MHPLCVHSIEIHDPLNNDHSDGEWKKIPDLCIAASSIAAGRGVLVPTPRHRKATRTQCTIRAPARDHESPSGSGSRKRSGVPSGPGILRTMVRSPHNFQVPLQLPGCSAGAVRNPKLHALTPTKGMQDHARDPGSNAARGIPCGPTCICNECHLVGTEDQ